MESFVGLPVTRCRRADSRARRKAADPNWPPLKWNWPPTCHCEAPKGPWQSREGSAVSYRLPLKWHAPIASVAALSERHAGWHYLRHKFIGARPPSLSFRGAKRRGNLLQPVTFSPRPTCYSTWYCEIATSAAPPRNDKSGGLEPPNRCCNTCGCQRRSLSAATDAIGLCVLSMPCTPCKCLPEIATGAKRPRNDNSGVLAILAAAGTNRPCSAGPGCPRPYKYHPVLL